MNYKSALLITNDLIRANHLLLIIEEMGIKSYNLSSNLKDAIEKEQYSGADIIFISKTIFEKNKSLQRNLISGKKPFIVMGQNKTKSTYSKFPKSNLIGEIQIPFVKYEVKTILNNLSASNAEIN